MIKISEHIPNKEKRAEIRAICEEWNAQWIEFYENGKLVAKAVLK
ncbi:MAG: hypothetical protein U9O94_01260 [Nanoarchaeota archaeon]|nr:hypothetical protein [Nanoarchaeota archaeon]